MKLSSIVKNLFSPPKPVAAAAPAKPHACCAPDTFRDGFERVRARPPVDLARPGQGTDAEFVRGLYRDLLGREPDAEGMKAHLAGLARGARRDDILQVFLNSDELKAKRGQAGAPGAPTAPGQLPQTPLRATEDPNTVGYVNSPQNKKVAPRSVFMDAVHGAIDRVMAQGIGVDPNERTRITNFDAYHSAVTQELLKAGYLAAYDGEELAVGRVGDNHSEQFDISTWQGEVRRFYAAWQSPPAFAP